MAAKRIINVDRGQRLDEDVVLLKPGLIDRPILRHAVVESRENVIRLVKRASMDRFIRRVRIPILAVFLLLPSWASADWWVGVSVGRTNNEYLPSSNPSAGESIVDQDTASRPLFGGISITPNLATEVEYANLNTLVKATSPGQSTEIKAKSLGISLVGKMPVHPRAHIFWRLGAGRWDSNLNVNGTSASGTGVAPIVGLGFGYRFYDTAPVHLDLRLEWTQYQNVGQNVATANTKLTGQNVDVLWLSIVYHIRLAPGP
ncbi:MAG: porin family protein [Burkholderiales bacterium]